MFRSALCVWFCLCACTEDSEELPVQVAQSDLERSQQELVDVMCGCYGEALDGSEDACRSRYGEQSEPRCVIEAYENHEKDALWYLECRQEAARNVADCLWGCTRDPDDCRYIMVVHLEFCDQWLAPELMADLHRCE